MKLKLKDEIKLYKNEIELYKSEMNFLKREIDFKTIFLLSKNNLSYF